MVSQKQVIKKHHIKMNSTILGLEETDLTSNLIQEKDRNDEEGWLIMA